MYKLVYAQEGEGLPSVHRLLAIFDEDYAGKLGCDDADYSLLDGFIKGVQGGGNRLLVIERESLDHVPPELS